MKSRTRKRCAIFLVLASLASQSGTLFAADPVFPTKTIRFILGYPPGGASDAVARVLAAALSTKLGQQVVIDNRPGAGGNIAGEIAARAAPDGHTWMLGNNGILATNQALYAKMPFDSVRDFATVALIGSQPSVLVVHPSLPVKTVRDLIALAKARPGELNYASSGPGTAVHLTGEMFKSQAQVRFVHIPYKGGGPAVIDTMSGQVQFNFATAASVIPYVKNGRLRAIAVTSAARSPSLPELPTVAEAALPGFEATTWHGIVTPVKTPDAVVARINTELNAVIAMPETRERFAAQGIEPRGGTSAEFASYLRSEIPKWTKVVRESGARAE